jgi:hypothetical protein
MKQYTFVLNFGYVESSSLSYFPFSSANKYKDAKVALLDLAAFLKEQYLIRYEVKPKKCCVASKEKDPTADFCSKCARSLTEQEFDGEHFTEWLKDMGGCDIDTFHGNFIDYDDTQRWQSNGLEGALNQRFVYEAEWVIAAAIGYPHQEETTFDVICKERSKAKRECFSYYD